MEEKYTFDLSQYSLLDKIGVGQFGEVYKAKNIKTGSIFAAKISLSLYEEDEEIDSDDILNHVREVNIMSKLNHPAIVKFIGYSPIDFYSDPRPVIITEYISRGSLTHFIELEQDSLSDPDWNITKKLISLYGIASAMSFLHFHNIIHRDLKPDNILMDENLYPKIADFGLSKILHSNKNSISIVSKVGFKGTIAFSPPEIISSEDCPFSKAGDVYAFGMIAYEVMLAKYPFKNANYTTFCRKICNGERPPFDDSIPDSYKSLIEKCWSQKPECRPSFDEIVYDLTNDVGFITDLVDENEFLTYIDYIDECKASFSSGRKIISIEEFKKIGKKSQIENDNSSAFQATVKSNEDDLSSNKFTKRADVNNLSNIQISDKSDADNLSSSRFTKRADANNLSSKDRLSRRMSMIIDMNDKSQKPEVNDAYDILQSSQNQQEPETNRASMILERSGVFELIKIKEDLTPMKIVETDDEDPNELYEKFDKYYNGKGVSVNKEEAAFYCQKAADLGNVDAMYQYAILLQNGEGVEKDLLQSCYYLIQAASNGHKELAYLFGLSFKTGGSLGVDKEKAAYYFKIAAEKGYLPAIKEYALMNINGDGIPINIPEARKYLKIGADQGIVEMIYLYAYLHNLDIEGVECDKKEAAKYHKIAADQGYEPAITCYAFMLCKGEGIEKNYLEASKYFKISADMGNEKSMFAYSTMMLENKGVSFNKEEILKYLKMAADKGLDDAIFKYAYIKIFGEGFEHDMNEGIKYYELSAEKGNVNSMYALSVIYSIDEYHDQEKSNMYMKMAAENGHLQSMFDYSSKLFKGDGIELNIEEGIKYMKMAADNGHPQSMFDYGSKLFKGDGIELNLEEGIKYIKMAADNGIVKAMREYGRIFAFGDHVEIDRNEGIRYLKLAAEKEDDLGMFLYGFARLNRNEITEENKDCMMYIKKAADKGLIRACSLYGLSSFLGDTIPINYEEAAKYIKIAADNGDISCIRTYSKMLLNGEGVQADKIQAVAYVKKAADLGDVNSMILYGKTLIRNNENMKEAAFYFKKAADLGDVNSMLLYGKTLLLNNENLKEAAFYFKKAADEGNIEAMDFYGNMLNAGCGIPIDKEKGQFYLQNAANKGYDQNESDKTASLMSLMSTMGIDKIKNEEKPVFECVGVKFSSKKVGTNLKKFKLFNDKFVIQESKNDKIVKLYKTGEYNIVEPICNFGMNISTSVDLLTKNESLRFMLTSKEIKQKFFEEFANVLQSNKIAKQEIDMNAYAPIFVPSNLIYRCSICFTKFTLLNPKNHCNLCGSCVDRKCFMYSIEIPELYNEEPKKVCNICYARILELKSKNYSKENAIETIKDLQLKAADNLNNPRFYKKA